MARLGTLNTSLSKGLLHARQSKLSFSSLILFLYIFLCFSIPSSPLSGQYTLRGRRGGAADGLAAALDSIPPEDGPVVGAVGEDDAAEAGFASLCAAEAACNEN